VHKEQIILASASPRRLTLLRGAGLDVVVRPVDVDEIPLKGETPVNFAQRMAVEKAQACQRADVGDRVLAGDTVVTHSGEILGKPRSAEHAYEMLRALSGRAHDVITGWALCTADGHMESGTVISTVTFEVLDDLTIEKYVATGEPLDKAGAYGIQGYGGELVQSYTGDFSNIVGFPLPTILKALGERGVVDPNPVFQRIAAIRGRIAVAAAEAGRAPADITIVAASKTQPKEVLSSLYKYGIRHFGESYVAEFTEKVGSLPDDVQWHFIGHLQRNKVKRLLPGVSVLQSIDSIRLGESVAKRAHDAGLELRVLLQVNLGEESGKSGVMIENVDTVLGALKSMVGIRPIGLMAIPPRSGFADARRWCRRLRMLRDRLATPRHPLPELSMGMSADFDGAILEGATLIRLGTILCGPRTR
jgi:MAF protein